MRDCYFFGRFINISRPLLLRQSLSQEGLFRSRYPHYQIFFTGVKTALIINSTNLTSALITRLFMHTMDDNGDNGGQKFVVQYCCQFDQT